MSHHVVVSLASVFVLILILSAFLITNKKMRTARDAVVSIEDRFASVADRLLALKEVDDIYKIIGEEIHRVCENSFVLVDSYDSLYDQYYSKGIYGINRLVQKGIQMSDNYLNAAFKLDDGAKKILSSGRLTEFEGGLYRVTSGRLPKEICREVESFFKMKKFYARGLISKGIMFGNVLIIPIYGNDIPDKNKIEAGIALVSDALYKKLGSK